MARLKTSHISRLNILNEHLKELENLKIEDEQFDQPEITMFHACKIVTSSIMGTIALKMLFESEEKNHEPEHQEVLMINGYDLFE